MEPEIIEVEACNRFFIVEQRWGFDNGKSRCESIGNRNNRPDQEVFETAYVFNPMVGPYARVYREWVRHDNRRHPEADRPRFAYIVEARTKRQVMEAMVARGHACMFNSTMRYPSIGSYQASALLNNRLARMAEEMSTRIDDSVINFLNAPDSAPIDGVVYEESEPMQTNARNREIAALAAAQRWAEDRINFLLSLPDEPTFEDDRPQVVYFQKRFQPGGRVYDYTAIKAGGKWYTSGSQGGRRLSEWDDLITWINEVEPTPVYVARKFKEI